MHESTTFEERIRARLAAGNPLSACDLAESVLDTREGTPRVRYLYLLSLATAGATQRALAIYPQLAPHADECDEDWLALPGRLYKDLAFAGIDPRPNLARAAAEYRAAHRRTGGAFTGVNAATLSVLAGERVLGEQLAAQVLETLAGESPETERDRYYWHASRAEALLLLGRSRQAESALRAADPLIRDDLTTRSRTRRQIGRIVEHLGLEPTLPRALALPQVYLLDGDATGGVTPAFDAVISSRLAGSPVFMPAPVSEAGLDVAEHIVDVGGRVHVALPSTVERSPRLDYLLERVEHASMLLGFLADEAGWGLQQAARMAHGLAHVTAASLGTQVCVLRSDAATGQWRIETAPAPAAPESPAGRRMVGLVFADVVGFSRYTDPEVQRYWDVVVPRFARVINGFRRRVLLRRTWGDGLHVVTADPEAAAEIGLGLIAAAREIRTQEQGRLARLEIRVGAHFAPAFQARNRIEEAQTYYGSQLSFAARVEPVTPPDTMYVSEPFVAELQLQCPGRFNGEYAGEVALAKRYGSFRMARLLPSQAQTAPAELDFGAPPLIVGVTGHLGLDGAARQRVRRALLPLLQQRFAGTRSLKLVSGFAPGADLVLADTVRQAAAGADAELGIVALLVGDPPEIIEQWRRRAAELGDPPSAAAQATVEQALRQWIQSADTCERLDLRQPPPDNVFRALAAQLAVAPDLLIAALRPAHPGKAGGALEVVDWRRDPSRIPAGLRAGLHVSRSRELILIDPDSGQTRIEGGPPTADD